MRKLFISIGIFFLTVQASFGDNVSGSKWDGSISLDAGSGFSKDISSRNFSYSSGGFSGWGRYSTDKFNIRMDLQCFSKFSAKSTSGAVVNANDPEAMTMNFDIKQEENTIFTEKAGVLMEYTPDRRNKFSFNFRQMLDRQTPDRIIISIHNFINEKTITKTQMYLDVEEGLNKVGEYSAAAKWNHLFDKPGREIESGVEWGMNRGDKSSTWNRMAIDDVISATDMVQESYLETVYREKTEAESVDRIFRFTPLYTENKLNASVQYRDVNLFDRESLNLELGMDLAAHFDKDRLSAANCIGEVWVDSLAYRRTFDFLSLDMAPRVKLSYSPGKFNINLQLTPDIYLCRLSGGGLGLFKSGSVYILPDFNAGWTPSTNHKLGISYKQGVVRPTYFQLCWFGRVGAYADEVEIGDPTLKPGHIGKASLSYTFHSGFFTGILEGTATMNWNKIDRVFNRFDQYRIYTWINSGHSVDNRINLMLKADLKSFNAEIGGYYTYFVGRDNVGNVTRSSDWGINADATLRIKGGWIFNARGRYQSKIIRTYSSKTEYVGCDVRVTKDFKKVSVYVEGRDLFDRPIVETSFSEDKMFARVEQVSYNRRIFSIGASFRF